MMRPAGWWSKEITIPLWSYSFNEQAMAITLLRSSLIFVACHIALVTLSILLFVGA